MNSFGKRRVGRPCRQMEFGASVCHPLTQYGQEQCDSHMVEDKYPCYWRLPKAKDCWGRSDRQSRNVRYQRKTTELPSFINIPPASNLPMPSFMVGPPPLPPRPVGYAPMMPESPRGLYDCSGRTRRACGSNPNCEYQVNAKRCIRKPGHLSGTQYEGPIGPMGFGKKKRYNVPGSSCNRLKRRVCKSDPNCTYTTRGCRRRKGTKNGPIYQGPSLARFGKKRYNVPGSVCNKQLKKICRSNPNCTYTKRGCRRRSGTKKGLVFEGPSLAFGKMRRSVNADIKALMAM